MKRSRFSDEQIIAIVKEQEAGTKTANVCRKYGISDATLYKWKAKYGGLEISEARRLKALEDENAPEATAGGCHARQCRAEGDRGKKLVTPDAKRLAVHLIREKLNLSERRACDIVGVARRVVRYEPVRPDDGTLRQRLRLRLRELAGSVAGSAIGDWVTSSPVRGWRPTTRSCCGSIVRRA